MTLNLLGRGFFMLSDKVLQVGNPILRMTAEPIENAWFGTSTLHELGNSLLRLMVENNGIGLAGPQMGLSKRIFVIGMESNSRRPNAKSIPNTVLINPVWEPISDQKVSDYEACLSVGSSLMAQVPRYHKIAFKGYDTESNLIETEVEGLHARVIQHEYDHLDGIIFLDRVEDTRTIGFYDELKAQTQ